MSRKRGGAKEPAKGEREVASRDERPYEPTYTGFDAAATERAQATWSRALESAGAVGEDANREYVDEGPAEAKRRADERDRARR